MNVLQNCQTMKGGLGLDELEGGDPLDSAAPLFNGSTVATAKTAAAGDGSEATISDKDMERRLKATSSEATGAAAAAGRRAGKGSGRKANGLDREEDDGKGGDGGGGWGKHWQAHLQSILKEFGGRGGGDGGGGAGDSSSADKVSIFFSVLCRSV